MNLKRMLVLSLLVLTSFVLVGCGTTTTTADTLDYEDFNYLESYSEIFDRREGSYLVYIYEPSCSNCNKIKNTVLTFASEYTAHAIYFFDTTDIDDQTGLSDFLQRTAQTSLDTPTLIVVVDNDFDKTNQGKYLYTGTSKIPLALSDLKKGAFDWQ